MRNGRDCRMEELNERCDHKPAIYRNSYLIVSGFFRPKNYDVFFREYNLKSENR